MKKTLISIFISSLAVSAPVNAGTFVPVKHDSKDVNFSYSLRNTKNVLSNTFLSTEQIDLQFKIKVKSSDLGQQGDLFLVANYQGAWFQKTEQGNWVVWRGEGGTLLPFSSQVLNKENTVIVLRKENLPAGEFLVYAGYKAKQGETIFYNATPATVLVFDKQSAGLHPVKSESLFANYLAHGSSNRFGLFRANDVMFSTVAESSGSGSPASVSQTNLQERGVDEADKIKTDGNNLYTLEACETDKNNQCLVSYKIQESPAASTQLSQFGVSKNNYGRGNIYLSKVNGSTNIIYQGRSFDGDMFGRWYSPYYWQKTQSKIKFIDIEQPENMQLGTDITLDTSIISSRLIDGVLYVVTRKNAYFDVQPIEPFPLIKPIDVAPPKVIEELVAKEVKIKVVGNDSPIVPEGQTISDLLPTISFDGGLSTEPLVQATDCYIPKQVSDKYASNTIITITAIPLDNPKGHYSTCIAGEVDTFYASTKALYLATRYYPVQMSGNTFLFEGVDKSQVPEVTTEIHKFSLAKGALDYKGSGSVLGHLGWQADKQPFRMGEHNGVLKVATSLGETWNNTSTSRVTLLREANDGQYLDEVSYLDNLGKPGERLFAARFIEDRAYLVTFKQTDPLYVLDFTDPEKPLVLGELEINGYSDYLHPIGKGYLLGIGKDAVPNEENPDAGAFYQGLKLSLFDVSSKDNLREIESVVLGKRGTESSVLSDHHALAWLPSQENNKATLTIPVQLHDRKSENNFTVYDHPSAYYDWTHTGLYTFTINTGDNPGIVTAGQLITDTLPEKCKDKNSYCSFSGQYTYNDRAVIQGETIHYIHNNTVVSSKISDLKN